MASKNIPDPSVLPAPKLLAPHGQELVNGQSVTFLWEPVEGAERYRLEVSTESNFSSVVLSEELPPRSRLTVSDFFPVDEQTFYWRVIAGDGEGWGHSDHVESFIAGMPESATKGLGKPDEGERYGPSAALVRGAAAEAAAEVAPGSKLGKEAEAHGVQHEGIEAGQIMAIALSIIVALAVIIILLFQWTGVVRQATEDVAARESEYPELVSTRSEGQRLIGQYGVVDRAQGVYRIPVDRAIDLLVQENAGQQGREYSEELPLPPGYTSRRQGQ